MPPLGRKQDRFNVSGATALPSRWPATARGFKRRIGTVRYGPQQPSGQPIALQNGPRPLGSPHPGEAEVRAVVGHLAAAGKRGRPERENVDV